MEKRQSFVFYAEWAEAIACYPNDVRLEIYEAAIRYAVSGETVELRPLAKMAFGFIKQDIDRNNSKYEEFLTRQKENGKKGGAPKGNKNAARKTTQNNPNNPTVKKTTQTTLNENDTSISISNNSAKAELSPSSHARGENSQTENVGAGFDASPNNADPVGAVFDASPDTSPTPPIEPASSDKPKSAPIRSKPKSIEQRKLDFQESIRPFADRYPPQMLNDFFAYWTEPTPNGLRMRFELEKTWGLSRRLSTWLRRDEEYYSRLPNPHHNVQSHSHIQSDSRTPQAKQQRDAEFAAHIAQKLGIPPDRLSGAAP